MKTLMIIAHPVQTFKVDKVYEAWIEMPVGARPFLVTPLPESDGMAVVALEDPAAMKVQHPIWVLKVGELMDLPIGSVVGAFIGTANLSGMPVALFRREPWPASALEARRPEGRADA